MKVRGMAVQVKTPRGASGERQEGGSRACRDQEKFAQDPLSLSNDSPNYSELHVGEGWEEGRGELGGEG